jgi:hypothetical protein
MWLRPRCPVDVAQQQWIESRWQWLATEFGGSILREGPVVLPTVEYFPDPYRGTEDDARTVFERVCGYMRVDPGRIHLGFYSEAGPDLGEEFRVEGYRTGTAGLHRAGDEPQIWIESSRLDDPAGLVSTMAHELGHVHLISDGRVARDTEDHEPLTDLLTVYFGLGVIRANSYLREKRKAGLKYTTWSLSRTGYLLAPAYAYALALFARDCDETHPAWARELRPDVRQPFTQGLRFLRKRESSRKHKTANETADERG